MSSAQTTPAIVGSFIAGAGASHETGRLAFSGPAAGSASAIVLEGGEPAVAAAVTAAKAAAASYSRSSRHQRVQLLLAGALALEQAVEDIAQIVCEDVGKPIRAARFEAKRGVELMRGCAAVAAHLGGETVPVDAALSGDGCFGFVDRVPYGIVAAITPFNAPINLLLQKVAPALAAGNVVIAKPAIAGLRAALRLAELFVAAGWPTGLFNVISGDRETAAALVSHSGVRAVSFTGGTVGGEALAKMAGAKKFLAELGSNAANIVFADADLQAAATKIASAAFEASGQQCISAQRILVEAPAADRFSDLFVAAAKALKVGDAKDPSTDIGPMINTSAADRVIAMYEDSCSQGAQVLLAPHRDGATVSPAILSDIPREARLWTEEAFGPIAVISTFESEGEAIALANDSQFGLQGAVFTRSLETAFRLAREFEVGSLWINEASRFRLDMYPFGGVKSSGIGREGLRYAIEELSQLKFVGIRA
jgi:acyl-CoA reductase-like NAD-dependent aldehyde dehydrogenase